MKQRDISPAESVTNQHQSVTQQRDTLARARPPYGGMSRLSRVTHQRDVTVNERDTSCVTHQPFHMEREGEGGKLRPHDLAHARAFAELHRHRCEVRHLIRARCERGIHWLREWLED